MDAALGRHGAALHGVRADAQALVVDEGVVVAVRKQRRGPIHRRLPPMRKMIVTTVRCEWFHGSRFTMPVGDDDCPRSGSERPDIHGMILCDLHYEAVGMDPEDYGPEVMQRGEWTP